jgi:hypothetical protein
MEYDVDRAIEWLRDMDFGGTIYIKPTEETNKLMKLLLREFDQFVGQHIKVGINYSLDKIDFHYGNFLNRENNSITFHSESPKPNLEQTYELNKDEFESIIHDLLVNETIFYDSDDNHVNFLRFSYANNFIPYTKILWDFPDDIQFQYLNGWCCELAYALHSKYKFPIYKIERYDLETKRVENDGFHWLCKYKNNYVDIVGLWTDKQLKQSWEHFAAGPIHSKHELRIKPIEFNKKNPTVDNEMFDEYFESNTVSDETNKIAIKIKKLLDKSIKSYS